MRHNGGCHCGAIEVTFESAIAPEAMEVRACQCSFCRKHASLAVSDPAGHLRITLRDPTAVQRYRFGLSTADYFLCRRCGVYVAAILEEAGQHYAIVIVNALEEAGRFSQPPLAADYSHEDEAARRRRRRERWTPAVIEAP